MAAKKKLSRYTTPKGPEAEFQPGSRRQVLRNRLGITRKPEMDRAEFETLVRVQEAYLQKIDEKTRFTAAMICRMHRDWLGKIYPWAGQYRGCGFAERHFQMATRSSRRGKHDSVRA